MPQTYRSGHGCSTLQFYYVLSLWTTVALNDVEFYALTFVERFEAFARDCAEVNEYIVAAFNFDETETFFCVEPFNCTLYHVYYHPYIDSMTIEFVNSQ